MRRDQKIIIALLCVIAIASAALFAIVWRTKNANIVTTDVSANSTQKQKPTNTNNTPENSSNIDSEAKEFSIVARKWEFSPSTITVNKGDRVIVRITSADTAHGFALPAFRVNERLEPSVETTIEFIADKVGTFPFFSSVFAGEGTKNMKGAVTVLAP